MKIEMRRMKKKRKLKEKGKEKKKEKRKRNNVLIVIARMRTFIKEVSVWFDVIIVELVKAFIDL